SHVLRHTPLKRTCLPVSPPGQGDKVNFITCILQVKEKKYENHKGDLFTAFLKPKICTHSLLKKNPEDSYVYRKCYWVLCSTPSESKNQ
ncbi:MAG: hypothetical protein Q8L90_02065, partial [Bacteroidota bacterium]|nr:hypothetical protein [Bacteroidota bacterium]